MKRDATPNETKDPHEHDPLCCYCTLKIKIALFLQQFASTVLAATKHEARNWFIFHQ